MAGMAAGPDLPCAFSYCQFSCCAAMSATYKSNVVARCITSLGKHPYLLAIESMVITMVVSMVRSLKLTLLAFPRFQLPFELQPS